MDIKTYTYDGDTPGRGAASAVREAGHIVVTNPDMLHSRHPPPPHPDGSSCLKTCDYIVIDELHTYRGVFGCQPGQRAAAPDAAVRILRRPPALHPVQRHHRQPRASWLPDADRAGGRRLSTDNGAPMGEQAFRVSTTRRWSTGSWASAKGLFRKRAPLPACCSSVAFRPSPLPVAASPWRCSPSI